MAILTRTVWLLSIISLFADIASEMLYPVMPLYLKEIGITVVWIGVLEGVANFTSGISKGYFGKLSDEKGVRLPFVKLGYFFSSISKPMVAVFAYPLWILFARTVDRLGKGIRTAARDALLSQEATKETKARVFNFHRGMDTTGAMLGPVAALLFLYFYPKEFKTIFYIAFIPGLISVLLIYLLKEKKQAVSTLGKGNFFSFFKYWKIASPEYKKLVTGLLIFALFNSSDLFLLLKTAEITAGKKIVIGNAVFTSEHITIGAYIFYNFIYAIAAYPFGSIADRMGIKKVFLAGLLLFAGVYAGFAFANSITIIFVLFIVYGLYAAATESIVKAWITNMAHEKNTATAIGFYTSCESICALVASVLAGVIWKFFGSTTTFLTTSMVALIVIIFLISAFRKQRVAAG